MRLDRLPVLNRRFDRRWRQNPLRLPGRRVRAVVTKDYNGFPLLILYDQLRDPAPPENVLVGALNVIPVEGRDYLVPQFAVAARGFGPLLYDLGSMVFGDIICPSNDLSVHAMRFWRRRDFECVKPLSPAAFKKQYRVSAREMLSGPWRPTLADVDDIDVALEDIYETGSVENYVNATLRRRGMNARDFSVYETL